MVFDVPVDLDLEAEVTRRPDRGDLRQTFREWELRDPLRRLEEALYELEAEAIPRPEAQTAKTVPIREGRPQDIDMLGGDPLALVALAPEIVEGELIPREEHWRFGAYAGGSHALVGTCDDPAELVAAAKDRPVVAHDAKALGDVPPNLVFDTEIAAYLLDPARRGYPLDELAEERGMAVNAEDEQGARAVLVHTLAEQQAAQLHERGLVDLLTDIELPLVHVLRECEKQGIKLDTAKLESVASRIRTDADAARARDLGGRRRGVRDRLAAAARPDPVREARPLAQAPRQDRLQHRRARAPGDPRRAPDHPQDRALPGALEARPDLPRRAPQLDRRRRPPAHDVPAGHRRHRPARLASTRTSRTSPSAPRPAARSAAASSPSPATCLIRVDYSQVELRVLAHIADEQVLRDIFLRGEDVHTETAAAVFDTAPDKLTVGMRSKAKMVNYGIVYGLSAYGLADRLQIEQDEAQEFIDRYLERFPAVAQFMADAVTQAEEHGYVSTLFGRRRQIPEIRARNWQTRKLGERLAVNSRHPGHRGRHHQGRDGPLPRCAARRRPPDPLHPADPRRAAVRGPGRGGRAGDRDRRAARWSAPPRWTRRSPSSRASARTGWTRSSGPRGLAVALTAVVGGMVALQGPINSSLGKTIGTFQAAFFSFATGTIILAVIAGLAQRRATARSREAQDARAAVPDRRRARRLLRLDASS